MNYEIVELKEKTAAVLTARTNNASPEMGGIIGGLWQKFYSDEIFPALKNRANAYALGLYTEYASDGKGDYTAAVGCETTDETELPDGMKTIKIPEGKYAVFSITGEMDSDGQLAALQNLRRELWGTDLNRSYVCDFEEYRSADPKHADIRVYIGLKQGAETGTDFTKVTPCGGDCRTCERFGNACGGCLKLCGKRRFSEQESSCEIFGCCVSHGVRFCGLCGEFPCGRVKNEITQWDSGAVENLAGLAAEYRKRETEFSDRSKKLWKKIGSHSVTVLSTCAENRVTSRPVSTVVIDGKFYFQTSENYLKFKQISQNENAAISFGNFSVEGKCRSIGKPDENDFFVKALKKHFPLAYASYSKLDEERVLEFVPTLIYSWNYELAKPYMEYWDFENLTYRKEYQK